MRDSQSLMEQIKKFLEIDNVAKNELGKNGRKKMQQKFDEKIINEEYIGVVNDIIG